MGFKVEQECPQCGAPVDLDEADKLLSCPYCRVKSFLFTPDYFRFILPHKAIDRDIVWAPYLRFRGAAYYCRGLTVGHRILDITNCGVQFEGIPWSLGVRPQTQKMRFITSEIEGDFLRFTLDPAEMLARAARIAPVKSSMIKPLPPSIRKTSGFEVSSFGFSDPFDILTAFVDGYTGSGWRAGGSGGSMPKDIPDNVFHQCFIGEMLSLIYFPMYVEDKGLYDAIINQRITVLKEGQDIEEHVASNPRWNISFLATLCPKCGWEMEGERDSVVLLCRNCDTVWEATEGRFAPVRFYSARIKGEDILHLPFWKIIATGEGVDINSFDDYVKVTGRTMVFQPEAGEDGMSFWIPAFKLPPRVFLDLSHRMTFAQENFETVDKLPEGDVHPVTLPGSEARECLKMTFVNSTVRKEAVYPRLPDISFEVRDMTLVYIPFKDTGYELVQQQVNIPVMRNALDHGRTL